MKSILWLSWKDIKNPDAGGAELVGHEIRARLVKDGFKVTHYTSGFPKGKKIEDIDGITTIRIMSPRVLLQLATMLRIIFTLSKHDYVIEEINTSPYFVPIFRREKTFLLFHQLTRAVWDYEFPKPLNLIGKYILEPIALKLLSSCNPRVFAMSNSTKCDLISFGFHASSIQVLPEASSFQPLENLHSSTKEPVFTILYFGSFRRMKRPEHIIQAFAHSFIGKTAQLWLAGPATEERKRYLTSLIKELGIENQTVWWGRVDENKRRELMEKSHIITVSSIKEGWGIIVTEAGTVGTPSVVYDVDGLRDSTIHQKTGLLVQNGNIQALGDAYKLMLTNTILYNKLREANFQFHSSLTFDKTYEAFTKSIQEN